MLALANSAPNISAVEFLVNGGPKADLGGCNVMSNASMNCNGHDLNAGYGDAVGTSSGCGKVQTSNMTPVTDPICCQCSKYPREHLFVVSAGAREEGHTASLE